MPASVRTAAALVVALMLLPACRAGGPGAGPAAGPSTGTWTDTSTGASTRSPGPAPSRHAGSNGARTATTASPTAPPPAAGVETIAYTPWGPDDPPVPGQYAALAATADRPPRCDEVVGQSPGGPFWTLVAGVCRALTAGAPWPQATTVPRPPAADSAYQVCLDDELTAMIRRALSWHARHPADRPRVVYPRSSSISPCQFRIYEARALTAEELASAAHDPGDAGIAVFGTGIADATSVTVDGVPVESRGDFGIEAPGVGVDGFVVLTRPGPRTVRVAVTTARGTVDARVSLPPALASATQSLGTSPGQGASPS
jgi:hypothetical protein